MKQDSAPQYEPTPKLLREQKSRVIAQCVLDTWTHAALISKVLYYGADSTKSPARRRIREWGVQRGFLQPVKPDAPKKSVSELLDSAERKLEGT